MDMGEYPCLGMITKNINFDQSALYTFSPARDENLNSTEMATFMLVIKGLN
jgi:hypothetical protein